MKKHELTDREMVEIISDASEAGRLLTQKDSWWVAWYAFRAARKRYNRRREEKGWPRLLKEQPLEVIYTMDYNYWAVRFTCDTPEQHKVYVFVKSPEEGAATYHFSGVISEDDALDIFYEMRSEGYWEEPLHEPTEFLVSEEI